MAFTSSLMKIGQIIIFSAKKFFFGRHNSSLHLYLTSLFTHSYLLRPILVISRKKILLTPETVHTLPNYVKQQQQQQQQQQKTQNYSLLRGLKL